MGSLFIRDGYTERGYIAGNDVLPALRFKYRPMVPDDVADFMDKLSRLSGGDGERFVAGEIAPRVASWDLADEGKPVPCTPETLLRIRKLYYQRLVSIVMGHEAGDVDPNWSKQDKEAAMKQAADAKSNGTTPGAERTAADAKN